MCTPRLLLTLVAALAPAAAAAQPPPPEFAPPPAPTISYEGTEVFRWLLHRADLKPLTETEMVQRRFQQSQADTVLIVLGGTQFGWVGGQQTSAWVTNVLRGGGAVLVADDNHATMPIDRVIFGNQPSQFTGRRVHAGPQGDAFRGEDESPFAEPVPRRARVGPEWDLFGGDRPLLRVATNEPGTLVIGQDTRERTPVIARLPAHCVYANGGGRIPTRDDAAFAAAAAERHHIGNRPYRFLAVADPDVFSNGLMVSTDDDGPTDNLEFAARVVTFLTEEDGRKQRTRCVLVVKGQVVSSYDDLNRMLRPPLPLPKLPPWDQLQPKLVDFGNQIVDRIQENDVPNNLMVGKNPEAPGSLLRHLLAAALVAAALWATVALVRRVWGARHPTDVAAPPPGGRPAPPPDGAAGVFGRRGRELAARDNLLEPARAAARDLFETVGGPPDPGPRLPKVIISDLVRRPETLRQALRDLWAIAYGRPTPVTAMRWAALEPLIPRALAAHRDGKWRFVESDDWGGVPTRPRGEA